MHFIRPCKGYISSLYGPRTHPVTGAKGKMHYGVDYSDDSDNTIVAAASGKVTYAKSTNGYGNTVMILHEIGGRVYETVYAHLASIAVKVGQQVKQGQKVAVKGTTGTSTGIHLHFEVHIGRWNNQFTNSVNPLFHVKDPDVIALQKQLAELGYKVAADGIYGEATKNAVMQFQKLRSLGTDGVAGRATRTLLSVNPPRKEEVKVANIEYVENANPSKSLAPEFERAVAAGITDGTYPQRPGTREEMAVMILRGMEKLRNELK